MSFSLDVKSYTFTAGERKLIAIPGTFFQIMQSTWPVDVEMQRASSTNGRAVQMPMGFSIGPLKDGDAFDGFALTSATAQTVQVAIARGPVDLRALTQVTGTVDVVNGELSRVLSGVAFIGQSFCGVVAGQYANNQLFNPATNTKNVVVTRITTLTSGASPNSFGVGAASAAATNLSGYGANKLLGGAASVAELRSQNAAAPISAGQDLGNFGSSAASESKEFVLNEPIVLAPGKGIVVYNGGTGEDCFTTFQWFEQ